MTEQRYCSVCHWSSDEPVHFPPRWRCVLLGKPIAADQDAERCAEYFKIGVTHE